jgi:hypothetical protein
MIIAVYPSVVSANAKTEAIEKSPDIEVLVKPNSSAIGLKKMPKTHSSPPTNDPHHKGSYNYYIAKEKLLISCLSYKRGFSAHFLPFFVNIARDITINRSTKQSKTRSISRIR